LTRSYESNGPDVKIRGTAHHVGEKYLQLARDAQSSGDPVMAESYLQHAEHYFRLIAAAQQAQQQASYGYQRQPGEAETEEFEDEDDFGGLPDRFASPPERFASSAPQPQSYAPPLPQQASGEAQPYQERPYYNNNGNGGGHNNNNGRQNYDRQDRAPRQDRNQDRNYQSDRNYQGQDRNQDRTYQGQDRNSYSQDRNQDRTYQDRQPYQDRQGQSRDQNQGRDQDSRHDSRNGPRNSRREYREPRPPLNADAEASLPAFITAPVRVQPEIHMESAPEENLPRAIAAQPEAETEGNGGYLLRPRRRRRSKAEMASDAEFRGEATSASDPVGE
jgi:hypothetical protein